MLEIKNIQVAIGGSRILREVSLNVFPREVVCLMGRNGVGKTTTLKSIMGIRKISSGDLLMDGKEISSLSTEERVRLGVGYVPQGREIFPNLTVAENLEIGRVALGRKSKESYERVFTLFPVLKEMLARKGGVLSGGQQQQLAIGRALLTEPRLLILDEPTEGIQPSIIDQIGDAILSLKSEMGILLVEQYLDFVKSLSSRFYIMDRGSVVANGNIENLTDDVVRHHLTV